MRHQQKHHISIHAPTRGATLHFLLQFLTYIFQSTHPRGVRLYDYFNYINTLKFQSTHPRGVRRVSLTGLLSRYAIFQSTHPRGVRHAVTSVISGNRSISIHAPTRGATNEYKNNKNKTNNFNPRTHEGCDVNDLTDRVTSVQISIHAPTRGATDSV